MAVDPWEFTCSQYVKWYAFDVFSEQSDEYVNIFLTLSMLKSNKSFSLSAHAVYYGHLFE